MSNHTSSDKQLAINGGSHTKAEWEALKAKYGHMCLRCGRKDGERVLDMYDIEITEDHIIPVTRGGGDSINNIQPLCRGCNAQKSNTSTFDYRDDPHQNVKIYLALQSQRDGKQDELPATGRIMSTGVGLKESEIEALNDIAKHTGIARNSLMRFAVRYFIKRYNRGEIDVMNYVEERVTKRVLMP